MEVKLLATVIFGDPTEEEEQHQENIVVVVVKTQIL
jgi:hypothetical protein